MFVDKQKLERQHLEELTKMGALFDTLGIGYCVSGGYGMLSHGIKTANLTEGTVIIECEKKEKVIEVLFKMNYCVCGLDENIIRVRKSSNIGDIQIKFILARCEGKNIIFDYKGKKIVFSPTIFKKDSKDVYDKRKGHSSFRPLPLEEIYLTKMGDNEKNLLDLELIKGSGKLDVERVMKLFRKNNML